MNRRYKDKGDLKFFARFQFERLSDILGNHDLEFGRDLYGLHLDQKLFSGRLLAEVVSPQARAFPHQVEMRQNPPSKIPLRYTSP